MLAGVRVGVAHSEGVGEGGGGDGLGEGAGVGVGGGGGPSCAIAAARSRRGMTRPLTGSFTWEGSAGSNRCAKRVASALDNGTQH